ncbi:MAG TPA: hypothetical protein LFV92_07930, partial [Rickettsia endosymbiont of Ceroptres masudai]|nr:hypothetical protein [Rickettsia endosymbiont of Ceroptres masudai]
MLKNFQQIVAILRKFDPHFNECEMYSAITISTKYFHTNTFQEIAAIITAIYPDSQSIIVSLLLHSIENNNLKSTTIYHLFTHEIFDTLNVLVKLFKNQEVYADISLETINQLSLDPNVKIRVLLIRFAQLLHPIIFDTSTLYIKHDIISREISKIYVPLFKEIKVEKIQSTLQDVCFQSLYPKLYNNIIAFLTREFLNYESITQSIDGLHKILSVTNIEYTISGRIKSPYSIARKMIHKSSSIKKLYDIAGIRIVVVRQQECYDILDVIHKHYAYIPERYKNYIQYPRQNGYQSLHTVITNKVLQKLEVQIRTKIMHYVAEYGIASHLQYKMQFKAYNKLNITFSVLNKLILNSLIYRSLSYFIMNDYTRIDSSLFMYELLFQPPNLQHQYTTPLHVSMKRGDIVSTEPLLEQSASPNLQHQYTTPLHVS